MSESVSAETVRIPALRVLMMPHDTNPHGTIFGGTILGYIDQAAAAATRDYPPYRFVTASMERIDFERPVFVGDLLSFYTRVLKVGRTSMRIEVSVEARRFSNPEVTEAIARTELVYVAIDEDRRPTPIGKPVG